MDVVVYYISILWFMSY